MTGWTLFFVLVGIAFVTAQLFRLIDLIERPSRRTVSLPEAWNIRLRNLLNERPWTFWKS